MSMRSNRHPRFEAEAVEAASSRCGRSRVCWSRLGQSRAGRRFGRSGCSSRDWEEDESDNIRLSLLTLQDGGKITNSRREFPVAVPLRRDVARLFLGMFHDARLIHHVPVSERDELLQVVGEQFPADVDPVRARSLSSESADVIRVEEITKKSQTTYLLTAWLTTRPRKTGTMWVKLNPESITSAHSGGGAFGNPLASRPYGTSAGAVRYFERPSQAFSRGTREE